MFSVKDSVPQSLRSQVSYKFTCAACNACYIGETTRRICTRVREHLVPGKASHVYKHLLSSKPCRDSCSTECFTVSDSAISSFLPIYLFIHLFICLFTVLICFTVYLLNHTSIARATTSGITLNDFVKGKFKWQRTIVTKDDMCVF